MFFGKGVFLSERKNSMNRCVYHPFVLLLAVGLFTLAAGGHQTPTEGNEPDSIVVTTLLDVVDDADGVTSLREALGGAEAGGRVIFDAALAGGTIVLGGAQLEITEGIAVDAGSVGGITIDAGGKSRVISVTGGDADRPAALIGLTVTGGNVEDDGDEDIHASGGGGIFNNGTLTIVNTVVFGNTACGFGGGIDNDGDMTVVNSTVAGNAAPGFGGGIANVDGRLTLVNSIVSCNRANTDSDLGAYYFSGRNNIVGADPGFAVPPVFESDELANRDAIDLTLKPGSWAIDRGANDAVETETDLAGNPRAFAAAKGPATVDIGAYEYQRCVEREAPSTVVTTPLDNLDAADGLTSLREAILYAGPGDAVTFDSSLGGRTITLRGSELEIDKIITVDASSVGGITIDAGGKNRVFHVSCGEPLRPVKLIGLTITGGKLYNRDGGGIYNTGILALVGSTVSGNYARYADGWTFTKDGSWGCEFSLGGGINNYGTLEIVGSTVAGNVSDGGGGIGNCGMMKIVGSSVSENISDVGGALENHGALEIVSSTVTGNSASSGAIFNLEGYLTLNSSIVALNHTDDGADIYNAASISDSGSVIGIDPGFTIPPVFDVKNLTNRGKLDLTPKEGSAAIDIGDNDAVKTETDLAGNPRVVGGAVDAGAYEYQGKEK